MILTIFRVTLIIRNTNYQFIIEIEVYNYRDMEIKPKISNVIGVGQFQTSCDFDLEMMASKIQGSRLNRKRFSGLIIRKSKPKGTILLFRSKKFVIVGADDIENSHVLSRRLAKDINKLMNKKDVTLKFFRVTNIIANGNIGYCVNISRISELPFAYKDDKSSGVLIKMEKVKCVILFENGKMILNGAKNFEDIDNTFQALVRQFDKFKIIKSCLQKNVENAERKTGKTRKTRDKKQKEAPNLKSGYKQQCSSICSQNDTQDYQKFSKKERRKNQHIFEEDDEYKNSQ